MIGYYQPLDKDWTLLLEANASPTHKILPKFFGHGPSSNVHSEMAGSHRPDFGGPNLIPRRSISEDSALKSIGASNRAAYSLSIINLEETGKFGEPTGWSMIVTTAMI